MNVGSMFGALLAVLVLVRAGVAHAGCGSVCEGTVKDFTVTPALACATFEPSVDTCGCAVNVNLDNDCSGELALRGAGEDCDSSREPCFRLPAGEQRAFKLLIHSAGPQKWSLPLRETGGGEHTVDVAADVSEFDGELGPCSVSGVRPLRSQTGWLVALLAAATLSLWRRPAQRRRAMRDETSLSKRSM